MPQNKLMIRVSTKTRKWGGEEELVLKSLFNPQKVVTPVLYLTSADVSANALWHERECRASPGGRLNE